MLVGTVISDQGGTLNIDQSFDGTNWDVTNATAVSPGSGAAINQTIYAPFVRVRYTNGATAQGYMRLFLRATGTRGT